MLTDLLYALSADWWHRIADWLGVLDGLHDGFHLCPCGR
jgi:hypothetical protein